MANPTIPCASLYVGDLHPDVTEAILYDKFQTHGNVLSIRVCRDLVTRKSLGYAYVNYQASSEAKSAMDNLNFEDIHGRPCRIMWSQRDPAARRSGVGNIFIKNLDPSITVKEINDTFANFGEISSCKVQSDENGLSKGFAFVNFNVEADAEKAIQAINGKMIREKIVYVAKFIPRTQRNAHNKDFTNCYIKNFGSHLLDKSLRELFEQYGEIVSAKVMVDKEGNSKGFGFVSYKEHEDALKAVNTLNGKVIEDKTIYVGRAMKKAERQRELRARYEKTRQERLQQHKSGVNLYIKNLGNDINDERLKNEFAIFGNITSAKVMLNKENNTSKGFGFVCFSAPDEATRAVSEMNGKIVEGKPLYVALAQKKEDRVAHLRSQFQQRVHQPQPAVFNPSMMNFAMMNPNPQRPFMARPANILAQNRWPQNMPYNIPRNIGMPANQNIMMTAGMPQNQQRRNVIIDPIISQNRNVRPISGNVQMPDIDSQIDSSTTSKIANADSMEAKQLLGEKIYPLISKHAGNMAAKITGWFLELDNAELLYMIENESSLKMKIDEALLVSNAHKGGDGNNRHGCNASSMKAKNMSEKKLNSSTTCKNVNVDSMEAKGLSEKKLDSSTTSKNVNVDPIEAKGLSKEKLNLSTTSKIANADSMEAKQLLGEKIYPLISKHAGNMAAKITGWFLELENAELLYMIENESSLKMNIDAALFVLNAHKGGDGNNRHGCNASSMEAKNMSEKKLNSSTTCKNVNVDSMEAKGLSKEKLYSSTTSKNVNINSMEAKGLSEKKLNSSTTSKNVNIDSMEAKGLSEKKLDSSTTSKNVNIDSIEAEDLSEKKLNSSTTSKNVNIDPIEAKGLSEKKLDSSTTSKNVNIDSMEAKGLSKEKLDSSTTSKNVNIYPIETKGLSKEKLYSSTTCKNVNIDSMEAEDLSEKELNSSTTSKNVNIDSIDFKQCFGEKIDLGRTSQIVKNDLLRKEIFSYVSKHAGDMAGSITDSFLKLGNGELLFMIANEDYLRKKINEAMLVLKGI